MIFANHLFSLRIFRRELIESLVSMGIKLTICIPKNNDLFIEELKSKGVVFKFIEIKSRGLNPFHDFISFLKIFNLIVIQSPAIVISYTIKMNFYVGLVRLFKKFDFYPNITGLGSLFYKSKFGKFIVYIIYRISLIKAKVVISENVSIDSYLKNNLKCKNTLILNGAGVNTTFFHYNNYPNHDVINFLYLGRFLREKGINELIDSIKKLDEMGFSFHFHFVGNGDQNLTKKILSLKSTGKVFLHEYTLDVRPHLFNTSCLVHPSYHEGMANVILEASSVGRPSIVSNIPGCKEAVVDNETGFLFKKSDSNEIFDCMKKMIKLSNKERETMGQKARNLMINNFEKKMIVSRTIQLIFRDII